MNVRSHTHGYTADSGTGHSQPRPESPPDECSIDSVDPAAVSRVRRAVADDADVLHTTAIFSALADPARFRILDALSIEELCVCDLAALSGVSQSGVSHHLRLLRERKLVAFHRDGNRAVYRLADEHVRSLLRQGRAHAAERDGRQ